MLLGRRPTISVQQILSTLLNLNKFVFIFLSIMPGQVQGKSAAAVPLLLAVPVGDRVKPENSGNIDIFRD
jgi:hypothetical protein